MKVYPYNSFLWKKMNYLSGIYTGVCKGQIMHLTGSIDGLGMHMVLSDLPNHLQLDGKTLLNPVYHVSGYGNLFEEAFIRTIGESVERYASVTHALRRYKTVNKSKSDLENESINVMPLEYINIISKGQREILSKILDNFSAKNVNEMVQLEWMFPTSLFDMDETIAVPASIFCLGYNEQERIIPTFSTGAACHESIIKAMINSIIECVQIDAYIYSWYMNVKWQSIKFESLPDILKLSIKKSLGRYFLDYEVVIVDFTEYSQVSIFVIGVFIISKHENHFPALAFGIQGGINLQKCIYRAVQEAAAVFNMGTSRLMQNTKKKICKNKIEDFADIDSNVEYFADSKNYIKNKNFVLSKLREELSFKELDDKFTLKNLSNEKVILKYLIKELQKVSQYACFQDITPPELEYLNMYVSRIYVPEFLQMCLPGYPPVKHPRLLGVEKNEYFPHPLP